MAVITFSRAYGSGGDEIAAHVSELLGYGILDKTLMAQMASSVGLSPDQVVDISEVDYQPQSFLDRLLGRRMKVGEVRVWKEDVSGVRTAEVEKLTDDEAISMIRAVIDSAAKQGSVIIVGRGGQAILKGQPATLHVRVEAPLEHRVQRVQERQGLDTLQAQRLVEDRDRAAQDYVRRYYDIDPADMSHYHVVLNTGQLDLETAAQVVVLAAQQMKPVPQPEVTLRMEPALYLA